METATDLAPFVESVRGHACLWNPEHEHYTNHVAREAAWREVVRRHDIADAATAKRSWKALRDTHREVMKRYWAGGGAHKNNKPWRYFEHMKFIVAHMGSRAKTEWEDENASEDATPTKIRRKTRSSCKDGAIEDVSLVKSESADDSMVYMPECETVITELDLAGSEKNERDCRDGPYEYYRRESAKAEDPLSKFFSAMCETTKLLPEIYQIEIKRKLFKAVSEAEEHYLKSHR